MNDMNEITSSLSSLSYRSLSYPLSLLSPIFSLSLSAAPYNFQVEKDADDADDDDDDDDDEDEDIFCFP